MATSDSLKAFQGEIKKNIFNFTWFNYMNREALVKDADVRKQIIA